MPQTNLPAHPLAALVAKAKSLPATTGATARAEARATARASMPPLAILADVSGSMAEKAGAATKIDALRASLTSVLADAPAATVIAYATTPSTLAPGATLPDPSGGTALDLALEAAAGFRRILVISDGEPNSEAAALRVAERIVAGRTVIDTLFIGSDGDRAGIAFMARLASIGRGTTLTVDIVRQRGDRRQLDAAMRRLALTGPAA